VAIAPPEKLESKVDRLQFWLLGPFQVWRTDIRLDDMLSSQRAKTLLALLLIERGQYVPAERLIEAIWSHLEPAAALNNLQVTVRKLRRCLEPNLRRGSDSRYLLTEPAGYRFLVHDCVIDVDEFIQAVQRGQAALRHGDFSAAQVNLERARSLYRGDFLSDYPYADWAWTAREQLRETHLRVLEGLGESYLQLGLHHEAIAVCQQALAIDRLREPFTRLLMQSKAALGQRAEALVAYEQCEQALSLELGVRPSAETRALRDAILAGDIPETITTTRPAPTTPVELPLVGRAAILERLRVARQEQERLVLLSGEAGAGKSRLLKELTATSGGSIFAGQARENSPPFATALVLFEEFLRHDPAVETLKTLGPLCAPLAQRLPALRLRWPGCPAYAPLSAEAERERLHQAALAALRLAATTPALFLLDDLHWADRESLAVLADLFRRPPNNALFVLAYCGEEATSALAEWLLALRQQKQPPTELELPPLSAVDVFEAVRIITGLPDALPFGQRLYQVTAGNPLFLTETLNGLRDAGWLYYDAGGVWQVAGETVAAGPASIPLTPTLREAILARAGRLEPFEREVLDAAAVLRPQVRPSILAAVLQSDPARLEQALQTLAARRFLLLVGDDIWEFSHHLVGEAIYADLSPSHRRLLHRLVATSLMEAATTPAGALAAEIVKQLQQGGGEGKQLLAWAIQAGQWAYQQFAYAEGGHYFELAQAQLDRLPEGERGPDKQMQVYEGLALAHSQTGQARAALASLELALSLATIPADRVRLLLAMTHLYEYHLAEYEQALALLNQIEKMLPALVLPERAQWQGQIQTGKALTYYWLGEYHQGEQAARQALEVASDASQESRALQILALNLHKMGQIETGIQLNGQLLAKAQAQGDLRLLASTYTNLGSGYGATGQLAKALTAYEQAGQVLEQLEDRRSLSIVELNKGIQLAELGELARSEAMLRRALALAETAGAPYTIAAARYLLAKVLTWRGQWAEAQAELEQAIALAESINARVVAAQATLYYGLWHWLHGNLAEAGTQAQAALDMGGPLGDNFCQRESRLLLGGIALATGDVQAAETYAREAHQIASKAQQRLSVGRAERLLGQISATRQQSPAAESHFAESEHIFRQSEAQIELGQTLLAWAEAGRPLGLPAARQQAWLLEARRLFRRAGARPLLRKVEKQLQES
jgi:DNA-binding SARP family transcriptional activator/predicted ATPase